MSYTSYLEQFPASQWIVSSFKPVDPEGIPEGDQPPFSVNDTTRQLWASGWLAWSAETPALVEPITDAPIIDGAPPRSDGLRLVPDVSYTGGTEHRRILNPSTVNGRDWDLSATVPVAPNDGNGSTELNLLLRDSVNSNRMFSMRKGGANLISRDSAASDTSSAYAGPTEHHLWRISARGPRLIWSVSGQKDGAWHTNVLREKFRTEFDNPAVIQLYTGYWDTEPDPGEAVVSRVVFRNWKYFAPEEAPENPQWNRRKRELFYDTREDVTWANGDAFVPWW